VNILEGKYSPLPRALSSASLPEPAPTLGRAYSEIASQQTDSCSYLPTTSYSRAYFLVDLFFGLQKRTAHLLWLQKSFI